MHTVIYMPTRFSRNVSRIWREKLMVNIFEFLIASHCVQTSNDVYCDNTRQHKPTQ